MRADLTKLLKFADENKFAVPAFNYGDCWEMEGIIEAAVEQRSPVIIATNAQVSKTHNVYYLAAQANAAADLVDVPVVNHLDHCTDVEICKRAIDSGYQSVMLDYSHHTLEENIEATLEVIEYAKKFGVAVEAELGRIRGINEEGCYTGDDFLINVEAAVKFVSAAPVTSLAVGIGNAHGFYTEAPKLRFDILREVNSAVDVPLVLHGGTGIPESDIKRAITLGINKVNIGTQIHNTYMLALFDQLNKYPDRTNIVNAMLPVRDAVRNEVGRHINICMAAGKADMYLS